MKTLAYLFLVACCLLFIVSCKKDNNPTAISVTDPFVVKYEITTTGRMLQQGSLTITDSVNRSTNAFTDTLPWTYTKSFPKTDRVMGLSIFITGLELSYNRAVTATIYINDKVVMSKTGYATIIQANGNYLLPDLRVDYWNYL